MGEENQSLDHSHGRLCEDRPSAESVMKTLEID